MLAKCERKVNKEGESDSSLFIATDRGILVIEGAEGDRALLLVADLRKILPERLNLLALANFCVFGH